MKIGKKKYIRKMVSTHKNANPKYYASCYGKIRFNSRAEAMKAAGELSTGATAYKCQFCPYFHRGRRQK